MCGQPLPLLQKIPMREFKAILAKVESLMGEAEAAAGSM
jgi:hypothetical protein